MRPVSKRALPTSPNGVRLKASQVGDLLLAALGRYCSFCERTLDEPVIRHKSSQNSVFGLSDWDNLLLACHSCDGAAQQAYLDRKDWMGRNLWPDAASTFTLDGRSPFQYVLQTVNIVSVSPSGEKTSLPSEQQVIVKPGTASASNAQATIDLFALNSIYYNAASNTMLIPQPMEDSRVRQRTETWQMASSAAGRLRRTSDNALVYNLLCEQITTTAKYSGFWSTWMTVFWNSFSDRDLLTRLFIETPKKGGFVFTGRAEDFTSGPFSYLPGTDKGKILGSGQEEPAA